LDEIWKTLSTLLGLALALADAERDPRNSDSLRGRRNFVVFVRYITQNFADFPSAKFHDI